MSSLAVPHNPLLPWLSPPYRWFVGHPWPACLACHRTHVPGLWVVVYDLWTQRHHVRALREVAGMPAARQPYLCHAHAHAHLQVCAAVRIPPRQPQPIYEEPRIGESAAARLAREDADDAARETAQLARDATARQMAQALVAADVAAPDWHRPHWFRPLRLPQLSQPNDKEAQP